MTINEMSANELIEQLELTPPIDVYHICEVCNIEIINADLKNAYAYFKIRNGRKVIFLSNLIVGTEKEKFTIAHELGHYFLPNHMMKIDDMYTEKDYMNRVNAKIIENDVDQFASELILPSKYVNQRLEKISLREFIKLKELANYYEVSLTSLLCRYVDINSESMALICYENGKQKWQYRNFEDFKHEIFKGGLINERTEEYIKDTANNWLDENFQGNVFQVVFDLKKYNTKLVVIETRH